MATNSNVLFHVLYRPDKRSKRTVGKGYMRAYEVRQFVANPPADMDRYSFVEVYDNAA